jgi:hypothetical protein
MQQKWRRVLELLHVGPIGWILTKKLIADWENAAAEAEIS